MGGGPGGRRRARGGRPAGVHEELGFLNAVAARRRSPPPSHDWSGDLTFSLRARPVSREGTVSGDGLALSLIAPRRPLSTTTTVASSVARSESPAEGGAKAGGAPVGAAGALELDAVFAGLDLAAGPSACLAGAAAVP